MTDEQHGNLLPAYLRPVEQQGRTYGRLSYNRRSRQWVVKGDPSVNDTK